MLIGYDSSTASDLPTDGDFYLAYIDGLYANYTAVSARFPNTPILTVSTTGQPADICDCETGDLTPDSAAAGYNQKWQVIYCNRSTYPSVAKILGSFLWYAADPTGTPHLVPGSWATQWAWPGYGSPGHYDISNAPTLSPIIKPPSLPVTPSEASMLTRNTHGKGYWAARPSGNVYAYDGAPYIGPAPKYLTQWGIGTPTNPVVGITDDGAGGFVLEADTNQYPGQPALYHITANGQFAT